MDVFASGRTQFETLFASYSQLGAMTYANQTKAREILNSMNRELKSQVRELPPQVYTTCKNFLRSLMYTACKCDLS